VGDLLQGFDFKGQLLFDRGVGIFVTEVHHFDRYFFFGGLVDPAEDVAAFGEVEVIVEAVGVMFYLLT
jgi:hypothetical protein